MKKECDIVQDLLFGYADSTLKDGSINLVEEHLKDCKECKEILENIKDDENNDIEKIDGLKKINKKMRNKKIFLIIVSSLLIIFLLFSVLVFLYYSKEAGKLQVFLQDEISEDKKSDIKNIILTIDENANTTYVSKEIEFENFKNNLGETEENNKLLQEYEKENNPFPASYIIETNLDKVDKMIEELSKIEEIKSITTIKNINPYALFVIRYILKK